MTANERRPACQFQALLDPARQMQLLTMFASVEDNS